MGSRHSPATTFMAWNGETSGGSPSSSKYTDGTRTPGAPASARIRRAWRGDVAVAHGLEARRRHLQHDALVRDRAAGDEPGEREAGRTAGEGCNVGDGAPRSPGLRGAGGSGGQFVEIEVAGHRGGVLRSAGVAGSFCRPPRTCATRRTTGCIGSSGWQTAHPWAPAPNCSTTITSSSPTPSASCAAASTTTTGRAATVSTSSPGTSTPAWPRAAGWASPFPRSTAAPAEASPTPR